jgi:ribosome maturation factor RimP
VTCTKRASRPFFIGEQAFMISKEPDRLTQLIEPIIEGLGYELVGIEFDARTRVLRVYIDQESGIQLDDCSRVSYQISGMLDVEDPIPGKYQLEISSPGLDRPLVKPHDFERFRGATARIQLRAPVDNQRRFQGELAGIDGDFVLIDEQQRGRLRLPFDAIEKARLVPQFPRSTKG